MATSRSAALRPAPGCVNHLLAATMSFDALREIVSLRRRSIVEPIASRSGFAGSLQRLTWDHPAEGSDPLTKRSSQASDVFVAGSASTSGRDVFSSLCRVAVRSHANRSARVTRLRRRVQARRRTSHALFGPPSKDCFAYQTSSIIADTASNGIDLHRGNTVAPIRCLSTAWAACRPSRIAHTTSDCPRRMSPQAKTLSADAR